MKNTLAIAMLAAATVPMAAHAEGSYVGAGLGYAEHKIAINKFGTYKDNDLAVKVFTGHNFDKNFGIEAGYADLGEIESVNAGLSAKGRSFYVAGTATLPLGEKFALTGKLGIAKNRSKFNMPDGDVKHKKTDALISVGATYAITKTIGAFVEFENYGNMGQPSGGASLKVRVLSTGMRFSF
ncbi:outer membrane beta-barrel protein [Massilia atriviolacea]|uniref:Porin family protein n=1 Tax=Massilia atriviolacea TaxID=2495579 RepID=A0A430HRK2_9BURK|nr:outer membrane beta-barrel protein [Massilia atriviolacea]RSZ60144.1 porin family protein [Massilia atriviolacea]